MKPLHHLLILSIFIFGALSPCSAKEKADPSQKTAAILTESSLSMKPEIAVLTLHFTGYGWTAGKARKKADDLIQKFLDRMEKEKIDAKHVEIGDARLKPSYQYNRDLKANVPSDFLVSRSVKLQTEDFSAVEKILDLSISMGPFILESAVLTIKESAAFKQMAFQDAIVEGRKKAESAAKNLGLTVAGILEIEELESSLQEINLIMWTDFAELASRHLNLKEEMKVEVPSEKTEEAKFSPHAEQIRAKSKLKLTFLFR